MKTLHHYLFSLLMLAPFFSQAYTRLTVNDPRNGGVWATGVIETASVSIEPQGSYLAYELTLSLSAGDVSARAETGDSLEIVCDFELPAGSFIKGADLNIDGVWTAAALMHRSEAHAIYEGVVQRRRDPLIIYKNYGDRYLFKIFPLVVGQTREMKLHYSMPQISNGGNKGIELPWELINASGKPVDLEINIVKSDDFTSPEISAPGIAFTEQADGSYTATVDAEYSALSPELTSDMPLGNPLFDYSADTDGIPYRFSFVPEKLFSLEENKKYLFIIDNDPLVIKDTSWRYVYNDTALHYDRVVREIYDIDPLPNAILFEQVKMMLTSISPTDSFNIILKNKGVYILSDGWKNNSFDNISSALTALKAQAGNYTTDMKELIKQAAPFINQDGVMTLLISNSKEFLRGESVKAQDYAREIVSEIPLSNPIDGFDISSVSFDDKYSRYYTSYLVSNLISQYSKPTYKYSRRIYSEDAFTTTFNSLRTSNASKVIMLNVQTSSDSGVVFDKSASFPYSALPYESYTELGKITKGTEFIASVAFSYKGERYTGRYTFPIGDKTSQMVGDAWAVKTVDALNNTTDVYARTKAEELSSTTHILTRNTALLSIDPDADVTPCYDCPDWGNWGGPIFMNDVQFISEAMPMMTTNDVMTSDILETDGNASLFTDGYRAGVSEGEANCISTSAELYEEAYADGYKAGITDQKQSVEESEVTFSVAPNPFTDLLEIAINNDNEGTLEIIDATGTIVLTANIKGNLVLNDANGAFMKLTAGVYVIKVTVDGEEYSQSIIKK